MNKERQIKEMAECICQNYDFPFAFAEGIAEILYDEGYRNAQYVAKEISDEVDYVIWQIRKGLASGVGCYNVKKN